MTKPSRVEAHLRILEDMMKNGHNGPVTKAYMEGFAEGVRLATADARDLVTEIRHFLDTKATTP